MQLRPPLAPTLNPVLREFWSAPGKRNRVLEGGRSSSKSWDAAGFLLFLAQWCKIRVVCTRQFQNRISDSVYDLLRIRAEEFGIVDDFIFQERSIVHRRTGSTIMFYGLARNINDIKGLESIDIMWHEECELMTEKQWKILDATLRKQGSQHWIIFNPQFMSDFVYQRFVVNPPPDTIHRKINYTENPFLSETIRKVIEAARLEDYDDYCHYYLGQPLSDDARAIIKRSWVEAAIDAHVKLDFAAEGANLLGFDIADDGDDKCANVQVHGSIALWADEWKGLEDELLKSCSRTHMEAVGRKANIRYDSIGVGASAGAKFDELNDEKNKKVRYTKFNAGAAVHNPDGYYTRDRMDKVKNKDHFSNLKAQTWWAVADRFRNTYDAITRGTKYPVDEMISISSTIPHKAKLINELATPHRDFDRNGRVKVESKEDLKKREVPSPNLADAFVMCYAPDAPATLNINKSVLDRARQRR